MKNSIKIVWVVIIFPMQLYASLELKHSNPGGAGRFGTRDDCGITLSSKIRNPSTKAVHIAMYTFTSPKLKEDLEEKTADGKKICILVDQYQYNQISFMKERMEALSFHPSRNIKVRLLGSDDPNDNMI
ncbi:MAG: hypothetical protein FJX18_06455 [Alphaproteobacteria bacterium]|nr:hypothetical protein [Alphaproteobacteria bacterium]